MLDSPATREKTIVASALNVVKRGIRHETVTVLLPVRFVPPMEKTVTIEWDHTCVQRSIELTE